MSKKVWIVQCTLMFDMPVAAEDEAEAVEVAQDHLSEEVRNCSRQDWNLSATELSLGVKPKNSLIGYGLGLGSGVYGTKKAIGDFFAEEDTDVG